METFSTVDRPTKVKGDIEGVKIKDISAKVDCVLALSVDGELFGWGNSEYHQLSMVTQETQVSMPRRLPVTKHCGKITRIAAGGSMCAILNGNVVFVRATSQENLFEGSPASEVIDQPVVCFVPQMPLIFIS